MIVSLKDSFKLLGVTIVIFCAVFVNTLFLNFSLDAKSIEHLIVGPQLTALYNAQMATAKISCLLSGCFLTLIAVVMIFFYIKLYIDNHKSQLGILKAMGYSNFKIALGFYVFGLSVLLGTILGFGAGFIIMPQVYESMAIAGLPEIKIHFHVSLPILLIIVPTAVFAVLSCLYAYFTLKKPVLEMLRGKAENPKKIKKNGKEKERPFLKEMSIKTLSSKKLIAFLIAFAGFCVSAMVQMALSMADLTTTLMAMIILVIGVVLAFTSLFMAITSLVNGNIKNVSILKAFGYSAKECFVSVLALYHIFALIGFAVGTVYQYILLSIMVNVVYKDVGIIPEYNFNVATFFIVLVVFIVLYETLMWLYMLKMNKISVKEVMTE